MLLAYSPLFTQLAIATMLLLPPLLPERQPHTHTLQSMAAKEAHHPAQAHAAGDAPLAPQVPDEERRSQVLRGDEHDSTGWRRVQEAADLGNTHATADLQGGSRGSSQSTA